ncbi:MAG TPA: hypothetical protein VNZ57_08440, partial [Longimicrobiales bacterium]|nr:hypothetical protein [Longimicrobiales bacterium]
GDDGGAADDAGEDEDRLSEEELKKLKGELAAARRKLRSLHAQLVSRLDEARDELGSNGTRTLALEVLRDRLIDEIDRYVEANRRKVIAELEKLWDKYRTTLREIEARREEAVERLEGFLRELGYV